MRTVGPLFIIWRKSPTMAHFCAHMYRVNGSPIGVSLWGVQITWEGGLRIPCTLTEKSAFRQRPPSFLFRSVEGAHAVKRPSRKSELPTEDTPMGKAVTLYMCALKCAIALGICAKLWHSFMESNLLAPFL